MYIIVLYTIAVSNTNIIKYKIDKRYNEGGEKGWCTWSFVFDDKEKNMAFECIKYGAR